MGRNKEFNVGGVNYKGDPFESPSRPNALIKRGQFMTTEDRSVVIDPESKAPDPTQLRHLRRIVRGASKRHHGRRRRGAAEN